MMQYKCRKYHRTEAMDKAHGDKELSSTEEINDTVLIQRKLP